MQPPTAVNPLGLIGSSRFGLARIDSASDSFSNGLRPMPSAAVGAASRCRGSALAAVIIACVAAVTTAPASPPVAPTEALSPVDEQKKFRLPPGFEIQLVASEPQIQKPMNMAFDARGRLWVTHSVEYPFPAAAAGRTPRDGVTVLDGFGPDGRATRATLFADGLDIPIGVLPLPSGSEAIVWSIPNIWKLTDTDGDGKADRREVLYGPFEFVDTHGDQNSFRLGADGWVYACHGFKNASKVRLRGAGDVVLEMTSGNTYRFRPDGSAIELVTAGQVNPFGMCFDAMGNQFNADCHSKPLTMLLRGGCYESFGRAHDGLGFAPAITGNNHGSTGIAGAAIYEAEQFPADWRGSAFVGNVITNTVHRDRLQWHGSSPWIETPEDFVACDDWWFRPVDLQLGPDGALYIADFYNCIIGHYEVDLKHPRRDRQRGRIWRVVWKGDAAVPPDLRPGIDLADAGLDKVVASLGHGNQTVRRLALEQLVHRFGGDRAAVAALVRTATSAGGPDPATAFARSLAVRGLGLVDGLDVATAARIVADPAAIVRVHLCKAIDALPVWDAARAEIVRGLLADPDPFVRRAAAEVVAVHPEPAFILPLVRASAAASADDVQLGHALRIALRNQLRDAEPATIAALPLADEDWPRLLEVMVAIPRESAAWFAFDMARSRPVSAELLRRCCQGVAEHCGDDRIDEAARVAHAQCADDLAGEAGLYAPLLDGLKRRHKAITAETELGRWGGGLADRVLASATAAGQADGMPPPSAVSLALDVAGQLRLEPLAARAITLLADARMPSDVRALAGATALDLDRPAALAAIAAVVRDGGQRQSVREALARRLGSDGTPEARAILAAALPTAPAGLQQPIAVALAAGAEGAEELLALVAAGRASARLLQDKTVLEKLRAAALPDLDGRVAELTHGLPAADVALSALIARVATAKPGTEPSVTAGAAVFQRLCATCHRFDGSGGMVGPQLDGVGQRGKQRLLEDILDPNRNVDEAFRTTIVTTADGRAVSGLKLREEAGDLVLADATGREVRIAAADVDETAISPLSPMPSNMADQIGEQRLPDLLAYLMHKR